jgi:hypothetical protein
MTKKVYKTAQGKAVDLGAIMLKNENTLAVGNMNVNARGDFVAPTGVVTTRAKVVSASIDTQISSPKKEVPPTSKRAAEANAKAENTQVEVPAVTFATESSDSPVVQDTPEEQVNKLAGLAAAIARTKVVQQEELTPANKQARKAAGVTRL